MTAPTGKSEAPPKEGGRLPVIDIHTHVASDRYIPRSFMEGVVENTAVAMRAAGLPASRDRLLRSYANGLQDHQCDALIAEMDDAGIEESVLLLPDFTYALRDCALTIEEMIVEHEQILRRHAGRLRAFVGVDPRWGADGLASFDRAISQRGFCGMKLYPPCGYSPSDPLLDPYYELCRHHGLPVLIHIGPTSPALSFEKASPFDVDAAARRFPEVRFILAHAAVSYVEDAVMMARFRPNVYLDISGFQERQRVGVVDQQLMTLFRAGISHKIVFGTDWPVFRFRGSQRSVVDEFIASSASSPAELANVLRGNALRLLAPRQSEKASARDGGENGSADPQSDRA